MARDFWSQVVEAERVRGDDRVPGSYREFPAVDLSCEDIVETVSDSRLAEARVSVTATAALRRHLSAEHPDSSALSFCGPGPLYFAPNRVGRHQ